MKKTFRFLVLSLMILGGTMISWAASVSQKPADGTYVGLSVSGGVVKYQVVAGTTIDYKAKNALGEEVDVTAYPVEISGLDYDGLIAKNLTELNIATSFTEKYGDALNGYYVIRIIDTQGNNASLPNYKKAFYAMTNLEKLTFAADANGLGVDKFTFTVGEYAFYGCTSLATLTLPDNVNKIGKYAFQNTAILDFTIPAKCETIGENAFYNTKKLQTVKVSEAGNAVMTQIGSKVFANSSVKTLNLENATSLEMIADDAFIYDLSAVNNQLQEVTLPKAVAPAKVSDFILFDGFTPSFTKGNAFANCTGLKKIDNLKISQVQLIMNGAFENCESLEELNFPATANIAPSDNTSKTSAFLNCPKLKKITFADGWHGIVGTGAFLSYKGRKVISGVMKDYTLTEADLAKELAHLQEIEFEGAENGWINESAFGNANPKLACSGLTTVKFNGLIKGLAKIKKSAFENCAALATLTFSGFELDSDDGILIDENAFMGTAIAAVDFKGFTLQGANNAASAIEIKKWAFRAEKLASVTFGKIEYKEPIAGTGTTPPTFAYTLHIYDQAFKSDLLKDVTFGDITACHATNSVLTIGDGTAAVFEAENFNTTLQKNGVLENVTFGTLKPGAFTIAAKAFSAETLKAIEFGDILTPDGINGALYINNYAFGWDVANRGTSAQAKSVEIGKINPVPSATVTTNTLYVLFADNAFQGDMLNSVEIGDITGKSNVLFNSNSFANTAANTDAFEPNTETITIGKLTADGPVYFDATSFKGSAKDGSSYTATLGEVNGGVTIKANAFSSSAIGEAAYTLGDIKNYTTVDAGAFVGANDEEGKTNTSVTLGEYAKTLPNANTFTNVNDLTTGNWTISSHLGKFSGVRSLKVAGDVTGQLNGGDANTLESIEITGNVSGKIGVNTGGFGKKVRKIEFSSNDPEVAAQAIVAGAFANASNDAKGDETISVIYRVETAKKSNSIFDTKAFGTDDAYTNVVLYTDEWSKANTFENVEIVGDPKHVYRMSFSASDVAPGEAIVAKCITGANEQFAYGRLYIPAGAGRYKIDAKYDEASKKNGVNVFYGNISGTDIYMNQLVQMDGAYWIDATEAAQTLIVRTSEVGAAGDAIEVSAEPVTDEEAAQLDADEIVFLDTDWFDAAMAKKNSLRYATEEIVNAELQNNSEFKNKGIYVMANPKTRNLAFAHLDQYDGKSRNMAKGSVYAVTRKASAARLNVIWPADDEEGDATAIQSIDKAEESNDAIYNLQGVRVKNAQKGLYIINGKKVIK